MKTITSDTNPLIEFNPKLPKLSKNEKKVLDILVEAGRLIAPVYLEQENQAKQIISKEEIEKAAQKDPNILSPYTVVEKINGELVAVPYHIKFAKFLKPIADKLNQASQITDNKEFARFLKLQAKVLLDGNYDQATVASLKMKPYILDISIGPLVHFSSRLLFRKASFHAWIGVMDIAGTIRLNNYKSITLGTLRKALNPKERIDDHKNVKAKVLDVLLFSGLLARTKFVGIYLPRNIFIVEKYGSEVTLFNQPNDLRLEEQIIPIFNRIFSKEFKEGFNHEDLRRGYLRAVALHELAHSNLHYKHAVENLQDLFPVIDELAATILGLRMAGSLLLKDRITTKQLESMIVTFLCRSFYHKQSKNTLLHPLHNYAVGGAVFINFMLQNGALKLSKELAVPNFMKIFLSLHELSDTLEHLLSDGSYQEAKFFVKKYT